METQGEATVHGAGGQQFPGMPRAYVVTVHGQRAFLDPGDWVIREPSGDGHYPCKPDIFEKRWEEYEA